MNVSVSVTDMPVFARMEHLFAGIKETGADGVEIVTGVKSRWRWNRIHKLAEKYKLPVTSIHQPPWSLLNIYFDEDNIKKAVEVLGVKAFVFHPMMKYSFDSAQMERYFLRLGEMQRKYGVTIMFENMPAVYRRKFADSLMPYHEDTIDISKITKKIEQYGLYFTLDTSHIFVPEPQKEKWFDAAFPRMRNIHLSSFTTQQDHLPLYLGRLKAKPFIAELIKRKYKGLLTFEIYYPKMIHFGKYDYEAIRRSVEIVKSV